MYTDASMTGWAACNNDKRIYGFWSEEETINNLLELLTVKIPSSASASELKSVKFY